MYNYNYRECVKADVRECMCDHSEELDGLGREETFETVYDACWVDDSVTGNASGSHTFSRIEARCNIMQDLDSDDYISEMVEDGFMSEEEVGRCVASSNWEKLDVCIRCWLLNQCISEILDEMFED